MAISSIAGSSPLNNDLDCNLSVSELTLLDENIDDPFRAEALSVFCLEECSLFWSWQICIGNITDSSGLINLSLGFTCVLFLKDFLYSNPSSASNWFKEAISRWMEFGFGAKNEVSKVSQTFLHSQELMTKYSYKRRKRNEVIKKGTNDDKDYLGWFSFGKPARFGLVTSGKTPTTQTLQIQLYMKYRKLKQERERAVIRPKMNGSRKKENNFWN